MIYSLHCGILKVLVQNFPGIFKTKVHSRCSYVTKQKNMIKLLIPHKHFPGSKRILKPTTERWTERLHCGKSEGHSTTWSNMVFPAIFHILRSTRFRVMGNGLLTLTAFISLKLTELMTFIFKSKFSCTSRPANCDFYYFVHCWGAVNIVVFLHSFRQNLREKQNTTTQGSLFTKHAVFPNVLHWPF